MQITEQELPKGAFINREKVRSHTYDFSVNADVVGEKIYRAKLHEARIFNAEQRLRKLINPGLKIRRMRVERYARLGKNNPHAYVYRSRNFIDSCQNAYQRIAVKHASTFDIYTRIDVVYS